MKLVAIKHPSPCLLFIASKACAFSSHRLGRLVVLLDCPIVAIFVQSFLARAFTKPLAWIATHRARATGQVFRAFRRMFARVEITE